MATWLLIYPLVTLLLVGLAIYENVNAATLSLPIPPLLTILATLLPFVALANIIFHQHLVTPANVPARQRLLAITLQALQAILTTALATLFLSDVVPSAARNCLLSTTWQRLFSAHDSESVRRIQDALDCCGFNTVRDRAWPFPGQPTSRPCAEVYARTTPCAEPWRMALQRNAGLGFCVVLGVGVLQISALILPEIVNSLGGVLRRRTVAQSTGNDPERTRLLQGASEVVHDGDGDDSEYDDVDRNVLVSAINGRQNPAHEADQSQDDSWRGGWGV
ncbi:uncharacterized protein DNG_07847 [Cephalotrichum gorgonifer]|uniref:Uncharacterized protein n=1 Tax=Cephalotrichum gorgonifer TaxID=2041049 RepID=A0AAE8SXT3_9PEZI|nr:uncharacterized protein DNG_07847 [Cephalotrichum gorgonifer]